MHRVRQMLTQPYFFYFPDYAAPGIQYWIGLNDRYQEGVYVWNDEQNPVSCLASYYVICNIKVPLKVIVWKYSCKSDLFEALSSWEHMSLVMRKPAFRICENKDADQLHSNCAADQRLWFRCTDSTIPLLPKSEISSL